jgi:hypothetical protein
MPAIVGPVQRIDPPGYLVYEVEDHPNIDYYLQHEDIVEFDADGAVVAVTPDDPTFERQAALDETPRAVEYFEIDSGTAIESESIVRERNVQSLPGYFDGRPDELSFDGPPDCVYHEATAVGGQVPLARTRYWLWPSSNANIVDFFAVNPRYRQYRTIWNRAVDLDYQNYEYETLGVYGPTGDDLDWIPGREYETVRECQMNDGQYWTVGEHVSTP